MAETLVDPHAYADGARIDGALAWLRRHMPLGIAQAKGYAPFWAVTRLADLQEVERRTDDFRSGDRPTALIKQDVECRLRERTGGSPHVLRSLLQMDAPEHMSHRLLTQARFMPANVRSLEANVREVARSFVDKMGALGGRFDFAQDIAAHYPLHVIVALLGVPRSDCMRVLQLIRALFGGADPDLRNRNEPESHDDIPLEAVGEFMEYFDSLIEERRARPCGDLASVIAGGNIDGKPLGRLEAASYLITLLAAGQDLVASTLAGAIWAIAENPSEFDKLRFDPSAIPGLINESARWVTPGKHLMRSAAADVELGGQAIRKGDWLLLSYQSANRDEAAFDEPFTFRITRDPNRHVAFGYGAHVCLGQHLARLEMRVFWEELLGRLQCIALDGEPRRRLARFVCGPKTVPVRYAMA